MKQQGQIQVELQESMGSDRSIAEAAWTSSTTLQGQDKKTDEDVERVVKMLIENHHHSPLEAVVFRFWMRIPIFTDRQHLTHRIASHSSHNGMSGRYRTMPDEWYKIPDDVEDILISCYEEILINDYEDMCRQCHSVYRACLTNLKERERSGVITNEQYKRVREWYRGILPQSSMTERVTIMNLRSFSNYMSLRYTEHAQVEIRIVAQLMLEEVKEANVCPIALEMLEKQGWFL